MGCSSWSTQLQLFVGIATLATCGSVADAQGVAPLTENATEATKAASDLLNKIDLLVEQNRQLEKQKRGGAS